MRRIGVLGQVGPRLDNDVGDYSSYYISRRKETLENASKP